LLDLQEPLFLISNQFGEKELTDELRRQPINLYEIIKEIRGILKIMIMDVI
jgi:hypothetical protein